MTPEEAANLRIRVAPPEAYRAAGVDYNAVLPGTRATLQRRPDGRPFVRLTSDRGVQEPFVDVILEITWATGRLVREYTLLFDPPGDARAPAPAPRTVAGRRSRRAAGAGTCRRRRRAARRWRRRRARRARRAPRRGAAPRAARRSRARRAARAGARARRRGAGADEYRVQPGDSLSQASPSSTQRPGVSLDQMLVALYRANPQAFIGNNMNRLKAGVVLAVPTRRRRAGASTHAEAREIIHGAERRLRRLPPDASPAAMPAAQTEGSARQASGKVQAAVDDRKQAAAPTPDKLTLSKGGASRQAGSAEDERLEGARAKAADARVAELSKNVEELKKLPGRRVAAAAAAAGCSAGRRRRGRAAPTPAAAAGRRAPPPAPAPVAAAPPPAPPLPPAPAPAPVATSRPPMPRRVAPRAAAPPPSRRAAPPVAAAAASAVAARRPRRRPPPRREPSFLGSLLDDNPLCARRRRRWLVALLAGFGIYRFTQRAKKDSGETSFLESRLQPDSFFGASGGQRIDTRDAGGNSSSMSYSLSQLDAIGDVDPVAEADVYLAYGRDLQAEEILKEAMRSNPERLAIRTKLLEVYAKRRDTKGFELLATQLFALTRGEGEDWAKAQELGAADRSRQPAVPAGRRAGAADARRRRRSPSRSARARMPQSVLPAPSQFGQSRAGAVGVATARSATLDLDLDNPDVGSAVARRLRSTSTESFRRRRSTDADASASTTPQDAARPPNEPARARRQRDEPLAVRPVRHLARPRHARRRRRADRRAAPASISPSTATPTATTAIRWRASSSWPRSSARSATRTARATCCRKSLAKASGATKSKAQSMLDDLG